MGKVVFWIVIVFAVLFLLRLYNVAQQKKRDRRQRGDKGHQIREPPSSIVHGGSRPAASTANLRAAANCPFFGQESD